MGCRQAGRQAQQRRPLRIPLVPTTACIPAPAFLWQVNGSRGVVTRLLSRGEFEADLHTQIAAARRAMRGAAGGAAALLSPGGSGPLDMGRAAMQYEKLARQLQVFQK